MFQYYEYKYLLEQKNIEKVKNILNAFYEGSDPYASGWVSSIYFDSLDRRSLKECEAGEALKRKFRIRAYNQNFDSGLQLQIKEKNLSAVKKYKEAHSGSINYWPEISSIEDPAISSYTGQYCNLEPLVRVDYLRHRYRILNYRATLDEDISVHTCHGFRERVKDHVDLPLAILELKTKDTRPYLPDFGLMELKQVSFSKFYLGVQCLRHEMDALNKYLG